MHIGIDFDNTIVSYDHVFHKVAVEQEVVPPTIAATKIEVRNWLRKAGKEDLWTEMQGYVYGARMNDAEIFPGVIAFLRWARSTNIPISIISHKTKFPFLGPIYDLHEAARCWIREYLNDDVPLVLPERVHFEATKEDKLARIASGDITHFIDDLPEILFSDAFPIKVEPILFDPDNHHTDSSTSIFCAQHWDELFRYFVK
jgi:hypothetical protein